MPKKRAPPEETAKQHERFKEAAHAHDADESGMKFEKAFCKIVPPLRPRESLLDDTEE